jgi:uncharacterized membrane protein
MNSALLMPAIVLSIWCFVLTIAVIVLWQRLQNTSLETLVSSIKEELKELRARVEQLSSGPPLAISPPLAPDVSQPPPPAPSQPPEPAVRSAPPPEPFSSTSIMPVAVSAKRQPAPRSNSELEALIGGNWLLKIGILAIVLGAVYFLKYAFDNQWIGNWGRVLIGALAGVVLLVMGEMFQKKKYLLYGQALAAGGISILYLAIYAAFNFYALMASMPAFLCMATVTAAGSLLARRHGSKALAVMSLLGGLLTPFWLSEGRNNEVGLLGYLLILDTGVGLLARRQSWYFLNMLSLSGTTILFYLWAVRYYGPYALWTTEIFLILFTVLYLYLFWIPETAPPEQRGGQKLAEPMTAAVVILFFVSSSAVLGPDSFYYWCFLALFDAILLRASLALPDKGIAPGIFVLNALGIAWWMPEHYYPSDRSLVFLFLSCVFVFFLVQQILHRRISEKAADVREVLYCLGNGIGYFGMTYFVMHLAHRRLMGLFALALAALYIAIARFLFRTRKTAGPVAQAFIGTAVTLVTLAIPIELHSHWITLGWAAEAVVLTWIGFSSRQLRFRQAGLVVLGIVLLRLLFVDAHETMLEYMLIFNSRFLTFAGAIAAVYILSYLYRRNRAGVEMSEAPLFTVLTLLASALSVLLISIECWAYYQETLRRLLESSRAGLLSRTEYLDMSGRVKSVRQMALSILWSGYSIAGVVAGIRFRFRPIRVLGIGLFFITIAKVFAADIWSLERLYRIISTITLGLILLGAAFLYQRFRKLVIENQKPGNTAIQ